MSQTKELCGMHLSVTGNTYNSIHLYVASHLIVRPRVTIKFHDPTWTLGIREGDRYVLGWHRSIYYIAFFIKTFNINS